MNVANKRVIHEPRLYHQCGFRTPRITFLMDLNLKIILENHCTKKLKIGTERHEGLMRTKIIASADLGQTELQTQCAKRHGTLVEGKENMKQAG